MQLHMQSLNVVPQTRIVVGYRHDYSRTAEIAGLASKAVTVL